MPVVTQNYSFSFNGQTFGGAGSPYQVLTVDGLEGVPGIRNQDDNRGYADGMFTGRDFLAGRTISITFLTLASTGASAQANLNTIQRALLPQTSGTTPLYFLLSNAESEQVINARVRGFRTTINPEYTYGYIISQVDFFCPDPRYYNTLEQTLSLTYSAPLGRVYNRTYNLTYGGGTSVLSGTVSNSGWVTTYPTITITGPIIDPVVSNATTGDALYLTGNYAAPDTIEIDLYNKLITVNGLAARNILNTGTWFGAEPGNNTFTFTGTGTLVGATSATITWQAAYI
jgi:hypothetical protein